MAKNLFSSERQNGKKFKVISDILYMDTVDFCHFLVHSVYVPTKLIIDNT